MDPRGQHRGVLGQGDRSGETAGVGKAFAKDGLKLYELEVYLEGGATLGMVFDTEALQTPYSEQRHGLLQAAMTGVLALVRVHGRLWSSLQAIATDPCNGTVSKPKACGNPVEMS